MIWDLYIVALNVINIALIPLEVGLRPEVFKTPGLIALDYFIDIMFLIDIIFNLRTTFPN